MAKKYVVTDEYIILGHVEYHNELVKDKNKIIGGGRWELVKDTNTLYFYGKSDEFGSVTLEQFKNSYYYNNREHKIIFSTKEYFSDALKDENAVEVNFD